MESAHFKDHRKQSQGRRWKRNPRCQHNGDPKRVTTISYDQISAIDGSHSDVTGPVGGKVPRTARTASGVQDVIWSRPERKSLALLMILH
jgi:hypothetical protein